MVYFDVTKSGNSRHRSGLNRVSARLREAWGGGLTPVRWETWNRELKGDDWYFTPELFSDAERPGWGEWLRTVRCRRAAIFHDAIPLKFPHITWPRSVGRHALYMKELARFDRVFAVSEASRLELLGFWRWQGVKPVGELSVISLGADGLGFPRASAHIDPPPPSLLVVGILEPRKNQLLALDLVERLWAAGIPASIQVVGRVNPHFGGPIVDRIKALRRMAPSRVGFHDKADDARLAKLYRQARLTLFPTLAEGCGLPVLESLWFGVPCLCNDLPVLRENSSEGGCIHVPVSDLDAWGEAAKLLLTDDAAWLRLAEAAIRRTLPTWASTAEVLRQCCGE